MLDAFVGRGWWGTNPLDRVDYLSATALRGSGFEGIYLGRLTEVRFPDYAPLRPTADVEVCLWQPNAPGGRSASWGRNFGLHRADAPVRQERVEALELAGIEADDPVPHDVTLVT